MAGKFTTLQRRLMDCERQINQWLVIVELVIFECVKLGYIWKNNFMFSKLYMLLWFTMCFWYVLHRRKIVPCGILVVGTNSRS